MIAFVTDYIGVFLLILTVVVFVHELGHFLVARACGVKVETFSIGFGPELFGYTAKSSGTRWKVSLLPLGGYVKMFGDADAASVPDTEAAAGFTEAERGLALQCKPVWQRAAIVAAGPLSNFVFGIVVMAVMFMVYGQPSTPAVVDQVQDGSAAAEAGLQPGDRVVEANGKAVDRFQDLQNIVRLTLGEPVVIGVLRDGQRLDLTTHPKMTEIKDMFGNPVQTPLLGIVANSEATEIIHHSPGGALWAATRETGDMVSMTLTGIGQMMSGRRGTDQLGGPLSIAKRAGQAAQLGFAMVVFYTILLSINLGLINLFPVPMLDGGHLLFYGIEALRGRPLGPKAQEYGFRLGLFLVFALMLLATRNDLVVHTKVWEFIKGIVS
jgi:regulator of sigma E protease